MYTRVYGFFLSPPRAPEKRGPRGPEPRGQRGGAPRIFNQKNWQSHNFNFQFAINEKEQQETKGQLESGGIHQKKPSSLVSHQQQQKDHDDDDDDDAALGEMSKILRKNKMWK